MGEHRARGARRLLALIAIVAGLVAAATGATQLARAEAPRPSGADPALARAFAVGYEQGAADARGGHDTGQALAMCEQRRQEAYDAEAFEESKAQDADTYAHCLRQIRDAEVYGLGAVRDVVARCTASFPP